MESLQARLDTYKAKRTKQSLVRSTSSSAPKWPHPPSYLATPRTLAEAGFYYDPSPEEPDNVTCFVCGKELSEWEPEDDPFELHYKKCNRNCAWASARCGIELEKGKNGQYVTSNASRMPTSKVMEKARLETFTALNNGWPHDATKGHGANSKKMAKAGFVFTPGHLGDDSATCFYCDLALNGWDEDDDPTEEHVKRVNRSGKLCPFLNPSTTKSTQAKAPSRATDSKPFSHAMLPSSEDELAGSIASAYNSNSNVSRSMRSSVNRAPASTSASKTPASGSRRSTRGTGSRTTPLAGSEVSETENASGSEAGKRVSKTKGKRKGTAASSKAKDRMQVVEEEVEPVVDSGGRDEVAEAEPLPKPKRGPGRPPKHKKPESVAEEIEVEPEPAKEPAKKGLARTRSKANLASDSDVPQSLTSGSKSGSRRKTTAKAKETPIPDTEDEQIQEVPAAKPGPGKRQTRKGEDSEPPSGAPGPSRGKGVKGRTVSRSKAKQVTPPEPDSDVEMLEEEPMKATAKATKARTAKGKAPARPQEDVSSASDDAGYATAEPPKPRISKGRPSRTTDEAPTKHRGRVLSTEDEGDSDVVMTDHAPAQPKDEVRRKDWRSPPRSTSSDAAGHRHPAIKKLSHVSGKSKVSQTTRSSTSTVNSSRTKIVEISDDEEDDVPPQRDLRETGAASAAATKGGRKLQPEVVVNKRLSQTSAASEAPSSKGRAKAHVDAMPSRSFQSPTSRTSTGSSKGKKVQVEVLIPTRTSTGSRSSAKGPGGLVAAINSKHVAEASASTPPPSDPFRAVTPPPASPPASTSPEDNPMSEPDDSFPFTPMLPMVPVHRLDVLTEEESSLTVEQWIRREIEAECRLLKEEAERRIAAVREKAAEVRKVVEAL
ncbi:hypothetical protein EVJ58_g196 [Rhodofomes roseus]|uniref:BIR-domain-containing protein n=1 Tax=Rhodofomes roseus TaxID=34475 RepID=A0A4Y9Z4R3_9APHY|nr:hypothetical protein EVJ58_g196 [Rhodofomes roseus]